MKKSILRNVVVLCVFAITIINSSAYAFIDNYPKNPKIDVTNYAFNIKLSDTTDEIICVVTIDVNYLADGIAYLRLDLINASTKLDNKGMTVSSIISDGNEITYTHKNDEILIEFPEKSYKNQTSQYTVSYKGIPATGLKIADNKYGDRTFFSDNWPNKGRNWLAMVDHPYDKAKCEFIVTAPNHYQVVSNGLKVEETDLQNGMRLTHWKQSVPIASWLYVLGVAKFAIQYVDKFDGKSIETWVYPQDRDAGFYDFAQPTKKVLEFYSSYIGPFSYERLANIQSNSVSGGMEAASAILYSEKSVKGDRNERWRNVVIHEIAHQWFGNAVTEYDWDEVWLSEGFATYFTLLFIEHEYGRDAFTNGLIDSKKRVDTFYEKNPEYTIIHDNLKDMKEVTSSQTYQKGSWILHMLRGKVGTDVFWKGIRAYYKKYKDLNTTTADFQKEMEIVSGQDLSQFFEQWLYKPGTLKYEGDWKYDTKKKKLRIRLNQVQKDGSLFKMPLEISIYYRDKQKPSIETLQVNEKTNTFFIDTDIEPENIMLDPNMWVLMDSEFKKAK
ncbi:M1 family metallopeptidase [Aureibaculum luteum]|uniref:M1 family metallopeptidase n=1 Tax=Aureibaculum luteum TaxID=1548456 RepID=UPI000E515B8C|nr:M1 family metallopeptidase [Aureibaculum luteum]